MVYIFGQGSLISESTLYVTIVTSSYRNTSGISLPTEP